MAIQIRKKESAPQEAQLEVKEAEVVGAGEPDVNVKVPEMNDKFLMSSGTIVEWLMKNRRMVTLCIAVVVVVCLSVIGYMKIVENGRMDRSALLDPVLTTLQAPTADQAKRIEQETADYIKRNGILVQEEDLPHYSYTVPNDKTRFTAIQKSLEETAPSLANTELQDAVSLFLAGTAAQLGDNDKAAQGFSNTSKSANTDIRFFSLLGEAEALVTKKAYDQAISKYDIVASLGTAYVPYANMQQGRIYELQGDVPKAVAKYVQVFKNPRQENHAEAEARLRLLDPNWQTLLTGSEGNSAPTANF